MKNKIQYAFLGIVFSLLSTGTMYGATPAKGVFSVSSTRKVQFANANSIYSDNDLIQWEDVDDAIESGWDVLTGEEWMYLLVEDPENPTSHRTNANNLNALGTVNGDSGLIILPDEWVQPAGIPIYKPVTVGIGYEKNIYSAAQWEIMAQTGAVFLPCAGYGYYDEEDGNKYKEEDTKNHGAYWAKDEFGGSMANCMRFNRGEIHDLNNALKTNFYSVILVKTVPSMPELYEEHESDDFEDDLEAATEKSFAIVNRTMAKDSTLYTICLPFDVPNVDASPLAGAEIFEFEGGHVSGAAGSEVLYLNMSRLVGKRLTQGVPYILRWGKTNPVVNITRLCFYNVENWDEDTETATDPGDDVILFHGVYPKAHIEGYDSRTEPQAHRNFFIGANNTLYWPDDYTYPDHKMKGFRAYFHISAGGASPVSRYRNMPAVWAINDMPEHTTDIQNPDAANPDAGTRSRKVLRDNQIVLMIDGQMYDMKGLKIED